MKRLRYENQPIDATDTIILDALTKDSRISVAQLSRKIGMSPPSVSERIKRLEEAGVIKGYSVTVSHKAIGLPIAAWLRIRPIPGNHDKVIDVLNEIPDVIECDRITGEDCFLARVFVATVDDLEKVIDQIIPYAMTNTSIIQSSPVERRMPKLLR